MNQRIVKLLNSYDFKVLYKEDTLNVNRRSRVIETVAGQIDFTELDAGACFRGTTFSKTVAYKDENGSYVDLSSSTVSMKVKRLNTSTDSIVEPVVDIDSNSNVILEITSTTTQELNPGLYHYDIDITTGSVVQRILTGRFEVI